MSKNKGGGGSPSTASTCSSSSPSSQLMSPRPDGSLDTTPKQSEKKKPWQKFEPSPRSASPGILKRSLSTTSLEEADNVQPCQKKRKVQFTDPPVSEEVVIPRCPSGKATRRKVLSYRFNKDLFLGPVKKNLTTEPDGKENLDEAGSSGLYQATPPETEDANPNCLYPPLVECNEPVSSILNNLTTKTWHKAAEKSLNDNQVKTIGDLSRLSYVKAGVLKSLKPPNNVTTIREALRKFEKIWSKRNKETKLKVSEHLEDDLNIETKEQSPTAAPVVDVQSTPEEEDETMKELYERPSPSPPIEIDEQLNKDCQMNEQNVNEKNDNTEENKTENLNDTFTIEKECDNDDVAVITEITEKNSNEDLSEENEIQEENTSNSEPIEIDENPNADDANKIDQQVEEKDDAPAVNTSDEKGAQTDIEVSVTTTETNTDAISLAEFGTQFNPIMTDATNNTDLKTVTVATHVCEEDLLNNDEILNEFLVKMENFNAAQLSKVCGKVAELIKKL